MKSLEEQRADVERERNSTFPMWDKPDNRKELKEIATRALDIVAGGTDPLRPDIPRENAGTPESLLAIVHELIEEMMNYLISHRSAKVREVSIKVGNLFEMGIEYMVFKDAEKQATFNPVIRVLDELRYDMKDVPYNDVVTAEEGNILRSENAEYLPIQFFEDRKTFKTIGKRLVCTSNDRLDGILARKYAIELWDWTLPYSFMVAFFRATKEYLLKHKDDDWFGITLKVGQLMDIGIAKNGEDDEDDCDIFIQPGQKFKLDQKHDEEADKGIPIG